jgi:hydroxymethylbilane synthase
VAGAIDCAVHSMKDVPVRLAEGCAIAAVPPRADPRDVLVGGGRLADLRAGTRVGTASLRRRAQLLARRRDLAVETLRGNVDTRLRRWRAGEFDCLLLAAAGLARLRAVVPEAHPLAPDELLPAVGQGALGLECRSDDAGTRALLAALDDPESAAAVAAERAFLAALGGDCNTPLAAHATVHDGRLTLRAEVLSPDGARRLAADDDAAMADAELVGARLACGAGTLLGS